MTRDVLNTDWKVLFEGLDTGYFSILNCYLLSINMYLPKHLNLILKPDPNGLILLLLKQLNRNTKHGAPTKPPIVIVTMFPTLRKEILQLLLLKGQNLTLNLNLLKLLNKIHLCFGNMLERMQKCIMISDV